MRYNKRSGFTLLELSIVLLVLSLMLGGVLTVLLQNARMEKRAQLAEKTERIKTAMLDFRRAKKRLPCPGNLTLVVTESNFGREGLNPTDCNAGTPAATFTDAGENIFGGAVPTRTLGLPDDYAFDPWGNRFLYVVDKRVTDTTANNPFAAYPVTHASIGNITVRDTEGDTITSRALYILLSHGPNGHGAYTRSGVRKSSGSTDTFEQANCHCNASATASAFDAIFYRTPETTTSGGALDTFDDKLLFISRQEMLSAQELSRE